jgi:hypothetical protein
MQYLVPNKNFFCPEREEEDADGARDGQAEGAGGGLRQGAQGLEVRPQTQKAGATRMFAFFPTIGTVASSVVGPHQVERQDPDQDPRQSNKLDPDLHQSDKLDSDPHQSEKLDPDPHQSNKLDRDPHQSNKQDPDPHQCDAHPQHW